MSSASDDRRSHERWRLTRGDGAVVELKFHSGITREDLRSLHRGYAEYEPIAQPGESLATSDDRGEAT